MDIVASLWSEIACFILGLGSGALITLTFTRQHRQKGNGTLTDQTNARAGGDIVGRDKKH